VQGRMNPFMSGSYVHWRRQCIEARSVENFFTFIFQLSGLAHVAPLWFLLTAEYAEGDRAQSEGQQYPQAL